MPNQPGNPDFQDYPTWLGVQLLLGAVQTLPPGHNRSGPQPLTSFRAAHVRVVPTVGSGTVTLSWYDSLAETNLHGTDSWGVNPATGLVVLAPCKGPVCDLDINNTSGANMTAATLLAGTNAGTGQHDYPVTQNKVQLVGQAVAAASTFVMSLPFIRPGTAWVSAQALDAAGQLSAAVVSVTVAGLVRDTLAFLGVLPNPTWLNTQAPLTDWICGLAITNADAVNPHSFTASLVATVR